MESVITRKGLSMKSILSALALAVLSAAVFVGVASSPALAADPQKLPGSDIIPADRLTLWEPGLTVGVPGGIPTDRNHLLDVTKDPYNADKTGAANASPAIMKAVTDAKDKDVVYLPAGTYRLDGGIGTGIKSNITFRGDGPDKTILKPYGQAPGIHVMPGDGGDWWYNRTRLAVTGSPKKGDTVITVGDTKPLNAYPNGGIGEICQLSLKNDPKLPVIAPAHFDYMRRQISRIVAKTDTTVTISPSLLFDLPADLAPVLIPAGRYNESIGIEDLTVDGTNTTFSRGLILMNATAGSWLKNVHMRNAERYIFVLDGVVQCQVEHCYIGGRKSAAGPNGGGLLMGLSSSCLIQDNIVADTFPDMEINNSTGNVFAYNFCDDKAVQGDLLGSAIDSNHGAHGSFNLYEGNFAPRFQCDGYHGSASHDTAFRNWFHGTSTLTDQYWICINLNRFTRYYNVVGNILGRKGYAWLYQVEPVGFAYDKHFIYCLGYPGMGNGWSNGKTAQPSKGQYWEDWEKMLAAAPGGGPGPNGFQELDLDVPATTILKGNFNYKDNAVPESESLKGAKLPNSLYLKNKPAWFGNLNWPPFGPDTDFENHKIPAQVRYETMQKADGAPAKK